MVTEGGRLEEEVLRLAEPLAASLGLTVVDVRYGRRAGRGVLEVCVDRARGGERSAPSAESDGGTLPAEAEGAESMALDRPGEDQGAAETVPPRGTSGQRQGVTRPTGVTLAECEAFSRRLSVLLDVEDPVRGSYVLEVASPGLDRVLRRPREFEHFRGRRVRLRAASEGPDAAGRLPLTVEGELLGLVAGRVRVRDDEGREWEVDLQRVARAELVPDLR